MTEETDIPEKAIKTIVDLKKLMKNQPRILGSSTFGALMARDNFKHVKEQLDVINTYRSIKGVEQLDPDLILEDILKLSASNVFGSLVAGFANGLVANDQEELKMIKSKAAFDVKQLKEDLELAGDKVRITERDVQTLARLKSQDAIAELSDSKTQAELLKFCYYAVRDFVESLKLVFMGINK